jgi:hypothetical protein
MEIAL